MSTDNKVLVPIEKKAPEGKKDPRDHHTQEWSTGQRGGGKVPEDFAWRSNPKQWQEELGTPQPSRRLDD